MAEAREVFGRLAARYRHRPSFHIELANACILEYESTRVDPEPDAASLQQALEHARTALRLNHDSGDAWATYGFVIARTGAQRDAMAALLLADEREPHNWHHQFRLAAVSWAE